MVGWRSLCACLCALAGAASCGPAAPAEARGELLAERPFPTLTAADFAVNPRLGVPTTRAHLLVAFRPDASDAAIADALARAGMSIVGAEPGPRLAVLRVAGEATWPALEAGRRALAGHPAVVAVVEDLQVAETLLPPASAATPASEASEPWWQRSIRAPIAWNLRPALAWIHRLAPERRVQVGLVERCFRSHPDLDGVLTIHGRRCRDGAHDVESVHAAITGGLIAAAWNGRFIDGVTPFVAVHGGSAAYTPAGAPEDQISSFGGDLRQAFRLIREHRPRVVNVSLGLNWHDACFVDPASGGLARCDPKPFGARAPDSTCNSDAVTGALQEAARLLRVVVDLDQGAAPVLWVVAAGNDAGRTLAPGQDYCSSRGADPPPDAGLGEFPAAYGDATGYLALVLADPNILVVGALARSSDGGPPARAWFSNVGPHMLAPGEQIVSLRGGLNVGVTGPVDGTSLSAPIVTGAAAYLLALDPTLDNAALRARLIGAGRAVVGESLARGVLDLEAAALQTSVLLADGRTRVAAAKLLADLDDGTADGFTRHDPAGQVWTGRREAWDRPRVDLADVRAFRDAWWMLRGQGPPCPPAVPACDLNGDGRVGPGHKERWPRIAFHGPETATHDLDLLAQQWDGDHVQRFAAQDLPALLHSADLHIDAAAFLARAGLPHATIALTGEQPPDAARLRDDAGARDILLDTTLRVVTTPYLPRTRLHVQVGGRDLVADITDVQLAEDRPLTLNPCALVDDRVDLLAPIAPGQCDVPDAPAPTAVGELWSTQYAPPASGPVTIGLDGGVRELGGVLGRDNLLGVEHAAGRVHVAGTEHIITLSAQTGAAIATAATTSVSDIVPHAGQLLVVHSDGLLERRTADTLAVATERRHPFTVMNTGCVLDGRLLVSGIFREGAGFKSGVAFFAADTLERAQVVEIAGKGVDQLACAGAWAWGTEFLGDRVFRIDAGGATTPVAVARPRRIFAVDDRAWVTTRTATILLRADSLESTTVPVVGNSLAFAPGGARGWINTGRGIVPVDRDGVTGPEIAVGRRIDWLAYAGE